MKKLIVLLALFLTVNAYAVPKKYYACVNMGQGYAYLRNRYATFYFTNGYIQTACHTTSPGYIYSRGGYMCVGRNLYVRNSYSKMYIPCRVTAIYRY